MLRQSPPLRRPRPRPRDATGRTLRRFRPLVQVFEISPGGSRLVDDFYATVESSRRPGMGPMAGRGAAVAHAATSVVTSGVTGLVGANGQTVEADARHLANTISAELEKFFARQGWPPV